MLVHFVLAIIGLIGLIVISLIINSGRISAMERKEKGEDEI